MGISRAFLRIDQIVPSQTIALDSNIFINALEKSSSLGDKAREVFIKIQKSGIRTYTSVITLQEVFVGVYTEQLEEKTAKYIDFISGGGSITIVDVTKQIALLAARIRAEYKVSTPDAIQLATAIDKGASIFVTEDKNIPDLIYKLKVISL